MKKLITAALLLLCVYSVDAQPAELRVKLGGFTNYDPAFYNTIVPMTGLSVLFKPMNGPLQLGPVIELGIDGPDVLLSAGADFNFLIGLRRGIKVYPGIDMRMMNAYHDVGFSFGTHAGLSIPLVPKLSFNVEAGPRVMWFNRYPTYTDAYPVNHSYVVGSGSIGLRIAL